MKNRVSFPMKRRLSVAICCLPGFALALMTAGIVTAKGMQNSMDINTLFLVVMGLACPIGMGLMMWMMNKQMNQNPNGLESSNEPSAQIEDRTAQLRLQRQLLDEEVKQLKDRNSAVVSSIIPISGTNSIPAQHESE
jgi:arginine exporter protein ArgO